MKLRSQRTTGSARGTLAFTMVEIALSIAIVAFAMVAIMGVLPTGLNVQRDNREDTIISQDAAFLMECLRSGSPNLAILTNNLEAVEVTISNYNSSGYNSPKVLTGVTTNYYTNFTPESAITYLSQPARYPRRFNDYSEYRVRLRFRAFSGSLVDKGTNVLARDFAFSYIVTPEILPFKNYDQQEANFRFFPTNSAPQGTPPLTPDEVARSNYWAHARAREDNLTDVRLTFEWPARALPGNTAQARMGIVTGNGRQSFHTKIFSAMHTNDTTRAYTFRTGILTNQAPISYP